MRVDVFGLWVYSLLNGQQTAALQIRGPAMMKKIPTNAHKKLAAVRALTANYPAVGYGTDVSDAVTSSITTAAAAWAAFDEYGQRWGWGVYEDSDGSYELGSGRYAGRSYLIAPADHRSILSIHARDAATVERAAEMERQAFRIEATAHGMAIIRGLDGLRYKITTEAAGGRATISRMRDGSLLPLSILAEAQRDSSWFSVQVVPEATVYRQPEVPGLLEASSIIIEWSEAEQFSEGQEFSGPACWAQVNARAALVKASGDHYYAKTSFKVVWPDGEVYSGRWDICANDHDGATLERHILDHMSVYAGLFIPEHMTADQVAEHVRALKIDPADFVAWLGKYRVGSALGGHLRREGYSFEGPAAKPRVQVWSDGSAVIPAHLN